MWAMYLFKGLAKAGVQDLQCQTKYLALLFVTTKVLAKNVDIYLFIQNTYKELSHSCKKHKTFHEHLIRGKTTIDHSAVLRGRDVLESS